MDSHTKKVLSEVVLVLGEGGTLSKDQADFIVRNSDEVAVHIKIYRKNPGEYKANHCKNLLFERLSEQVERLEHDTIPADRHHHEVILSGHAADTKERVFIAFPLLRHNSTYDLAESVIRASVERGLLLSSIMVGLIREVR